MFSQVDRRVPVVVNTEEQHVTILFVEPAERGGFAEPVIEGVVRGDPVGVRVLCREGHLGVRLRGHPDNPENTP